MSILCRLGYHKLRTTTVKRLPAVLPKYPAPAYIQCRCMRCGKQDWYFVSNRPTPREYNAALHADYHAGVA